MLEYSKICDIDQFILNDNYVIPKGNCYFANIVISLLIRDIDPTITFGSFLGFEIDQMVDTWDFLARYVDYHFLRTWGITNEFLIKIKIEDFDKMEDFKRELLRQLKYKNSNCLIGICLSQENLFYRNDIDLDFWGSEPSSHFLIIYNLDFENDSCTILDATPSNNENTKSPVTERITVTKLLSYLRKDEIYLKSDKDFVWLLDIDAMLCSIIKNNGDSQAMLQKSINSLVNQAANRLNKTPDGPLSPIAWLKSKWDSLESIDTSFVANWFDPRLNIFQIISAHRYYVCIFIEKYLKNYTKVPVTDLLDLLKKSENDLDRLKYLCYKLSVSSSGKNAALLKSNIEKVLHEADSTEIEISKFIMENIIKN